MSYNLDQILKIAKNIKEQTLPKITYEPELVRTLQINLTQFVEAIEERKKHEDEFTITVIGLVKAGKSSLLNSLLFDGLPVLPTAESPKTAALTVLRNNEKDETFYADIEFMDNISKQEIDSWDEDMQRFYHQEQHRILGKDKDDLANQIKPFVAVGENDSQSYAEYIKVVNMYLPGLHDAKGNKIRVVDTPGLDDPNVIRSEKTEIFLPQTDAFVFLYDCQNFTGASQEYLFNLNNTSYSDKLLLIATKLDMLLAAGTVRQKLFKWTKEKGKDPLEYLHEVINDEIKKQKCDVVHKRISEEMEKMNPSSESERYNYLSSLLKRPIFFTSMYWNPQTWEYDPKLKNEGENQKKNIERYFNERQGKKREGEPVRLQLTDDFLKALSGIGDVKKEYENLKKVKQTSFENWIDKHIRKFSEDNENRKSVFSASTEDIVNALSVSLKVLEKGKEEIESHIKTEQKTLQKFSKEIEKDINVTLSEFNKKLDEQIKGLEDCINHYKLIVSNAIKTDYRTEKYTICLFWTKEEKIPFTTQIEELKTISVKGELNNFYQRIKGKIDAAYKHNYLNFSYKLQKQLLPQIISMLHEEHVLLEIEIEKMIKEMSSSNSWDISIDMKNYEQSLYNQFPVRAQGKEEVQRMKKLFEECKGGIFKEVCLKAKENCEYIRKRLKDWQENFITACSANLEKKEKTLTEQIKEKETNKKKIEEEIGIVEQIKIDLCSLHTLQKNQ